MRNEGLPRIPALLIPSSPLGNLTLARSFMIPLVAGACSVPNALIVPFSFELVHHAVAGVEPATFGL